MFNFKEIEEKIGYHFKNKELLRIAFTRESYRNENKDIGYNYQVLEFYGDRVLASVVMLYLLEKFDYKCSSESYKSETELSNFIMYWTNRFTLSQVIKELGISQYMFMGNGERNDEIYLNVNVMCDLFEALVCAVWLDQDKDYNKVKEFVCDLLKINTEPCCFEKNDFMCLKEWCDNTSHMINLDRQNDGYRFELKQKDAVLFCNEYKVDRHTAQIDGAKDCIEYLKDNELWNLKNKKNNKF